MENKNQQLLNDFASYCEAHPELRFWQAIVNWSEFSELLARDADGDLVDLWYRGDSAGSLVFTTEMPEKTEIELIWQELDEIREELKSLEKLTDALRDIRNHDDD